MRNIAGSLQQHCREVAATLQERCRNTDATLQQHCGNVAKRCRNVAAKLQDRCSAILQRNIDATMQQQFYVRPVQCCSNVTSTLRCNYATLQASARLLQPCCNVAATKCAVWVVGGQSNKNVKNNDTTISFPKSGRTLPDLQYSKSMRN